MVPTAVEVPAHPPGTPVATTDSTATFDIEGHTRTDGTDALNLDLSAQCARQVLGGVGKIT